MRYEVDVAEYVVPNTYEEAVNGKDAAQAIEEELIAHEINHTWLIVPRTPAMKTIDSKWVFKKRSRQRSSAKQDCVHEGLCSDAESTSLKHLLQW